MGQPFLVSKVTQNQDPAADAILTHELPVLPITALMIGIQPLQESSTFTTYESFAALLDAFNNIRITHEGLRVFDMSGRDAYMLLRHRHHRDVIQNGQLNTDNIRRSITLGIMFGRHLGDRDWAIPETRAGSLVLELDADVASAGYDDLQYSVEAIQIPGARPSHFLRSTTISATFGATGINTIDLPTQGDILGLLCFQTTTFSGATPAPSLGRLRVLKNEVAVGYAGSDVEITRAVSALAGMGAARFDDHVHFADLDAGADADTEPVEAQHAADDSYVYLDFDLDRKATYSLDARGAQRLVLESDAETADAVRVVPVEVIPTSAFGG